MQGECEAVLGPIARKEAGKRKKRVHFGPGILDNEFKNSIAAGCFADILEAREERAKLGEPTLTLVPTLAEEIAASPAPPASPAPSTPPPADPSCSEGDVRQRLTFGEEEPRVASPLRRQALHQTEAAEPSPRQVTIYSPAALSCGGGVEGETPFVTLRKRRKGSAATPYRLDGARSKPTHLLSPPDSPTSAALSQKRPAPASEPCPSP